jgi:hypothetical protein
MRDTKWELTAPVDWSRLAHWVERSGLPAPDVLDAVLDTHGWEGAIRLVESLGHPGNTCLAIAEALAAQAEPNQEIGSPQSWATAATIHGMPRGSMRRVLALGVDPIELAGTDVVQDHEQLFDLTRRIQERSVLWDEEEDHIGAWMDACALAAQRDPLGASAADALIVGEGWYRCWLRFALALSRADAAVPTDQGRLTLEALHLMTGDLRPFVGHPRSCDLYSLHPVIEETITHALSMLDDDQWRALHHQYPRRRTVLGDRRLPPAVAHRARLPDVQARPTGQADAHLALVFAALAISHRIKTQTGWTIKKFVRALRRYAPSRSIPVAVTAEDPLPDEVRQALAAIHQGAD